MAGAAAVVSSLLLLLMAFSAAESVAVATVSARSNCTRSCGDVSIPYPFGVEPGCYHAAGFNLSCNHSYHPPRLFGDGLQVLDISIPAATVCISIPMKFANYSDNRTANKKWVIALPQRGSYPYFLSDDMAQSMACGFTESELIASCTVIRSMNKEGGNLTIDYSLYNIDIWILILQHQNQQA